MHQTVPIHPSCAYRYVGPGGVYFCGKKPGHSDPHGSWCWTDPPDSPWFDPTAAVAQTEEPLTCNEQVPGSIPGSGPKDTMAQIV